MNLMYQHFPQNLMNQNFLSFQNYHLFLQNLNYLMYPHFLSFQCYH
jgi:hypothetical protein